MHYQQLNHRHAKHYRSRLSFWKCQFGIYFDIPIILPEFTWWFSSVSTFKRWLITLVWPGVVPSQILSKSSFLLIFTVRCYIVIIKVSKIKKKNIYVTSSLDCLSPGEIVLHRIRGSVYPTPCLDTLTRGKFAGN